MNRKAIFDQVRRMLGRGFTSAEVAALDGAIDSATRPDVPEDEPSQWLDIAVPLIQQFEGYATKTADGGCVAYPDPASGGDPWTIGFGSTGPDIVKNTRWTREQCEARFRRDVAHFGNGVEAALGDAPTNDHQMAAMVSLAYNVGLTAFKGSTLLKLHKAGSYRAASAQFVRWNRAAGRVLPGLTKRRQAEAEVYSG